GEEEQKGNALVKETRSLFQDSSLRYLGNVEGREIFCGSCDVIVCDGFVGNIVLKVSEGLAEKIMEMLFRGLESIEEKDGSHRLQRQGLRSLATRLHYSEYGGAPLLGVDGIVIIGHGRSDGKAIVNALGWVREMQRSRVNEFIVEAVADVESK
ncbi:MAG: phosphate--acyl-ACP acyltransferase, partial [Planctomycetota bacterium]